MEIRLFFIYMMKYYENIVILFLKNKSGKVLTKNIKINLSVFSLISYLCFILICFCVFAIQHYSTENNFITNIMILLFLGMFSIVLTIRIINEDIRKFIFLNWSPKQSYKITLSLELIANLCVFLFFGLLELPVIIANLFYNGVNGLLFISYINSFMIVLAIFLAPFKVMIAGLIQNMYKLSKSFFSLIQQFLLIIFLFSIILNKANLVSLFFLIKDKGFHLVTEISFLHTTRLYYFDPLYINIGLISLTIIFFIISYLLTISSRENKYLMETKNRFFHIHHIYLLLLARVYKLINPTLVLMILALFLLFNLKNYQIELPLVFFIIIPITLFLQLNVKPLLEYIFINKIPTSIFASNLTFISTTYFLVALLFSTQLGLYMGLAKCLFLISCFVLLSFISVWVFSFTYKCLRLQNFISIPLCLQLTNFAILIINSIITIVWWLIYAYI